MIKVFGHKSPDTDATCAAISYAWYLHEKGFEARAYVLGGLNREAEFVLKTFNIEIPELLSTLTEGDEVAIVDTNNPEELPENIGITTVLSIVDHHKLAGLKTESPLAITMKPVGCTSTIIYQMAKADENNIPKDIASLLLSAILSDTLKFTSPTTTEEDKKAALELAQISGVDIDAHAEAMFAAKSDLGGMSARDVLLMDSKVFDFGGKKVRISSLETTKPENAKQMVENLVKEMETLKKEESLDMIFFFIVNILETSSELLVSAEIEREVAKKAFEKNFSGDYMVLPGVVSRKKQMAPKIEAVVS